MLTRVQVALAVAATVGLALLPGAASAQRATPAKKARAPKRAAAIADPAVIDLATYNELLARHRGKWVMVNFWATWCEPCRDEFPMVNELAQRYAGQGLHVIGISLDEDGQINLVRRFLARVNPVFPNYRKRPGADEAFINGVNQGWTGAIPATFFYAPDGQRAGKLVGEHKREDFERTIQQLLERRAPR